MNPLVLQYISVFENPAWPVNESIIDRVTQDYPAHLTGLALERAKLELEIMAWSDTYASMRSNDRVKDELLHLHQRIDVIAPEAIAAALAEAAATSEAAADAAAAAANASSAAASDAGAASAAADAAAGDAAEALSAAQASSAAAASAAAAASTAVSVLAAGVRVGLKAQSLETINVAAGAGTPTLVPWPSPAAIRSAPYTRRPSSWSIVDGRLRVTEPGLYLYTLSGTFSTELVAAGTFRFAVSTSADPSDAIVHAVQVPLLNSLPAGLSGTGVLAIPAGGIDVSIHAGHTVPTLATALAFSELRMHLTRIDLDA